MRMAFLGDGSLNHVRRRVGYFHERRHDVLLVSFEEVRGCPFPARRLRKHLPTKLLGYISAIGSVRRELKSFRPELVNAMYVGGYGFMGALAGHRPLVVSAIGSDLLVDYRSNLVHRLQISYAVRRADLVTTDADILSEIAVSIGAPRDKVLKNYFGIDDRIFHPRPGTGGPEVPADRSPRIVTTRNLYRIYSIDTLIEASPEIIDKFDARFIVCGDGPERAHLEKKASGLGVAGNFTFMGGLEPAGIAEELRSAAVYVSTSLSDSTSVSLLEAMACGAPPVLTDLEANREWIDDGVNGLLIPPASPRHLAEAVIRMLEDRNLANAAREKNLKSVRERGLWSSNMELLERAFTGLVKSRTRVSAGQ